MTTTTTNQIIHDRDRRIGKSIAMVHSSEIYKFPNEKETYKVQSETQVDRFYIVRFQDGSPLYCTCKDFELRSQTNRLHICKHMRAVVLADNYGLVKEFKKVVEEVKEQKEKLDYEKDDYSF